MTLPYEITMGGLRIIWDSMEHGPTGMNVDEYKRRSRTVISTLAMINQEWGEQAKTRLMDSDLDRPDGSTHPYDRMALVTFELWALTWTGTGLTDGAWQGVDGIPAILASNPDPIILRRLMDDTGWPLLRVWVAEQTGMLPFRQFTIVG